MTGMNVKVGAAYKDMPEGYERVGGVWKPLLEGHERVGGVWKQFYTRFDLDIANFDGQTYLHKTAPIAVADVGVQLLTDGTLQAKGSAGFVTVTDAWGRPITTSIGDDYEVRLDVSSGSPVNAARSESTGVWLALTSTRKWEYAVSGGVVNTGVWRVRVRDLSGDVLIDGTATYTADTT